MLARSTTVLYRHIHYSKSNATRNAYTKPHSDMRDLREHHKNLTQTNGDAAFIYHKLYSQFWPMVKTYSVLVLFGLYCVYRSRKVRRKFEINYLASFPQKEYAEEDYELKFWEFSLPYSHHKYGQLISSENSRDSYILMYHGSVQTPNHIVMQRFSRVKKHILLRKVMDIECLFVSMDDEIDPKLLIEYTENYGRDMVPCWVGGSEAKEKLQEAFLNLGCIYVFEQKSGKVIYIIDPAKYTLEYLSSKILYTINKYEDLRISREWMEKGADIRTGAVEVVAPRVLK